MIAFEVAYFAAVEFHWVILILWLPKWTMMLLYSEHFGHFFLFLLHGWILLPLFLWGCVPDTKFIKTAMEAREWKARKKEK